MNDLIANIEKLHTTELGAIRIKKNLRLEIDDVVKWCKEKVQHPNAYISRKGKNFYVSIERCTITVKIINKTFPILDQITK